MSTFAISTPTSLTVLIDAKDHVEALALAIDRDLLKNEQLPLATVRGLTKNPDNARDRKLVHYLPFDAIDGERGAAV